MQQEILLSLTKGEDIVINPIEKKHCFFVGKPGQETNATFEEAYEIIHSEWPKNVEATYEIGSRMFSDLSFNTGRNIARAKGAYQLKKHADGTVFLGMKLDYQTQDAFDKMYGGSFQRAIYRENGEVVVIQAKYGHVLPKINVFVGLKDSVPYLDTLLDILDHADELQMTQLRKMMLCVAQKYHLSDDKAAQIEAFIVYTCLDAANYCASFGIFKSKKNLSYELLKAVFDYICGNCFPTWYRVAPRRRYEVLGELTDYMRRLKRTKSIEWNDNERAFCHFIRHAFDAQVFADVYTVSLILLKFLAENDVTDMDSFKSIAGSAGIFSSTLMADTVDGISIIKLSSEIKSLFFLLLGTNPAQIKKPVEAALYRYHASSNLMFRTAQEMSVYAKTLKEKTNILAETLTEKAAIAAAANAALTVKAHKSETRQELQERILNIMRPMCENICRIYDLQFISNRDWQLFNEKLAGLSRFYLDEETAAALSGAGKTAAELENEFLPENAFVLVYTAAYLLLQMVQLASGDQENFDELTTEADLTQLVQVNPENLKTLILEAKYRYGAMCGAQLSEVLARLNFETE